jgi:Ni/Co efflux regulator RcnB
MKSTTIVCTALAATLGFASAAQARDWNHDGQRGGGNYRTQAQAQVHHQGAYQARQGYQRQYAQPQARVYQNRAYQNYAPQYAQRAYNYAPQQYQYRARGYAPQYSSYSRAPRYFAGGYAPSYYRSQRYWVNDWRVRGYAPPPYGYQWVETDTGDVLLVALATGLIASAILAQ